MKKAWPIFLVFVAAFLGVFLASRVDRWMSPRGSQELEGVPPHNPEVVEPAQLSGGAPFDFRAAAKRVIPSVVSVDKNETIRDFFTSRVSTVNTGTGSGVVVDGSGLILTNNHVVEGADSLTVRLADRRSYSATLVGADPRTDLALIKISAPNLVPAELGSSKNLEIGQWVMAIGNPLGYDNTLSVGVVSSLNRTISAERGTLLSDAIQTDAAINSGNSGGALTDDRGRVIGINSAIATPTGGSVGIGFAIPVDRAKRVLADLRQFGRVKYGFAGIDTYSVTVSDPRAQRLLQQEHQSSPPKMGLIVSRISPRSPAEQAGIGLNEVLAEADGVVLREPYDLYKILLEKREGDSLRLKVWSHGKERQLNLRLSAPQEDEI